jgi:predicted CXXCH cytochrome family protein
MKKRLGIAVAGALAALLPLAAAYAAITNSKHDLSSASTAPVKSSGTDQICVFCHTPHKAQSTQLLWNHTPTSQTAYSWGDTQTSAGTPLPTSLSNRSKRCLSCHDGSIALGDVTNFGGAAGIIGVPDVAGAVSGGRLTDPYYLIGGGGLMTGNHPVGIPYPGQTGSYNTITSGNTSGTGYVAAASITGSATATVKLFADTTNTTVLGVECSSCHDVHNSAGLDKFLWKSNAGSALCLSCHQK